MLRSPRRRAPKTSAERSREFRERHPGYYQRLHARKRAEIKAGAAKLHAALMAEFEAKVQAWREAVMPPMSVPITHLLPPAEIQALALPASAPDVNESSMPLFELIGIPSVEELAAWGREKVGVERLAA
jgi:hypothetical protein